MEDQGVVRGMGRGTWYINPGIDVKDSRITLYGKKGF